MPYIPLAVLGRLRIPSQNNAFKGIKPEAGFYKGNYFQNTCKNIKNLCCSSNINDLKKQMYYKTRSSSESNSYHNFEVVMSINSILR